MNLTDCANLTDLLRHYLSQNPAQPTDYNDGYYDDSANSYKYIIFVLVIYAVSFMALMLKYFWNSHEGKRYDNLYEEYVKRDGFKRAQSERSGGVYVSNSDPQVTMASHIAAAASLGIVVQKDAKKSNKKRPPLHRFDTIECDDVETGQQLVIHPADKEANVEVVRESGK